MTYRSYLLMTAIGFSSLGGLGVALADAAITSERIQACITNMCGSPRSNMNGDAAFERIAQTPSAEARRLSSSLVKDMLKLAYDQYAVARSWADTYAKEISKDEPIILTKNQKILFSFLRAIQLTSGQTQSLFRYNSSTGGLEVNPETHDAYLSTLSKEEADAVRMMIQKVFLPVFGELPASGLSENAVQARLRSLYPTLSLKDALIKDGKLLLGQHARIVSWIGPEFGGFLSDDFELHVLQDAAQGLDLKPTQIGVYEKVSKNLAIFSKLLVPEVMKVLEAYPLDLQADVKKMRDAKFAEKKMIETQEYNTVVANSVAATCQTYMSFSFDGNTSELRIRKFKPVIAQVEAIAKIVAARMVDKTSVKEIEKTIDDIQFSFPTTNVERLENIRAVLENEKMSVIMEQQKIASGNRALIIFSALGNFLDSKPETMMDKIVTKSPLKKACQELPIGAISDFALSMFGKVSISWYSLAFPDRGAATLAHEIGHVVAAKLRQDQVQNPQAHAAFTNSMSCVANRNPSQKESVVLNGWNQTLFSSEDWADHFSALTMEEFSKRGLALGEAPSLGCTMLDNKNGSYSPNKVEAAADDNHSSGFLRLLMTGQDRNKLTPDCRSILEEITPKRTLQCH